VCYQKGPPREIKLGKGRDRGEGGYRQRKEKFSSSLKRGGGLFECKRENCPLTEGKLMKWGRGGGRRRRGDPSPPRGTAQ